MGPIFENLKCVHPLWRYNEYHRKLDEYKETLVRTLNELKGQKEDIELRLSVECRLGKLPNIEVKNWLENTQTIIHEVENTEDDTVNEGKWFSRARLEKLIDKKIQEVKEYYQKGGSFSSLVIDGPLARDIAMPTTMFVGETTTKKEINEIWEYLMGNEVKKIGVCGEGGVGKTTIMKDINNRLLKETDKFDIVIWITVSRTVDILELQKKIAIALKIKLGEEKDKIRRAEILSTMLKERRFVLIMDDVWEEIQLEELGVPEPTEENKCKLVITTRSLDVCHFMGCKPVKVKPLSETEALELFLERGELDISKLPTLKEKVELIVKECNGLPLAVVMVAGSMKGEDGIRQWRNALCELSNNVKSIGVLKDKVYGQLKFSYDRLKDEKVQHCFLYCTLYPEDSDIPKNELVDRWIEEGLVDEMDNLQATKDRAHIILKRLINNCLLLESSEHQSVKLHDVVRDLVLTYITSKSPMFMVKAGMKLENLPNEQEWKEDFERISLMKNSIREISFDVPPNFCRKLSTLFLQMNPLERISETFFVHMKGLKILNLSKTAIEYLPDIISDLTNLIALLLEACYNLKEVPSLAKLLALKNLNLRYTSIEKVPRGLEMLTNLRNLDLYVKTLEELPNGILPKLPYLQKFSINWGSKPLQATIEEAARLRKLDSFKARFVNLQDLECYTKCLKDQQVPNKYDFIMCDPWQPFEQHALVKSGFRLFCFDKCMTIICHHICEREGSILLLKDVQCLSLSECNDVISISDVPAFNTLERLEVLQLLHLPKLTVLYEESKLPLCLYSNLKILVIVMCPRIRNLFSSKLLPELKNLEEIEIHRCFGIREIITLDVDEEKEKETSMKELSLPKLRRLNLTLLFKLKSICGSNGVILCDSLQEVEIKNCSLIKRLPFQLPVAENGEPTLPSALRKIKVQRKWWESLEWEHLHPNAKSLLLPFCDFIEARPKINFST